MNNLMNKSDPEVVNQLEDNGERIANPQHSTTATTGHLNPSLRYFMTSATGSWKKQGQRTAATLVHNHSLRMFKAKSTIMDGNSCIISTMLSGQVRISVEPITNSLLLGVIHSFSMSSCCIWIHRLGQGPVPRLPRPASSRRRADDLLWCCTQPAVKAVTQCHEKTPSLRESNPIKSESPFSSLIYLVKMVISIAM